MQRQNNRLTRKVYGNVNKLFLKYHSQLNNIIDKQLIIFKFFYPNLALI